MSFRVCAVSECLKGLVPTTGGSILRVYLHTLDIYSTTNRKTTPHIYSHKTSHLFYNKARNYSICLSTETMDGLLYGRAKNYLQASLTVTPARNRRERRGRWGAGILDLLLSPIVVQRLRGRTNQEPNHH